MREKKRMPNEFSSRHCFCLTQVMPPLWLFILSTFTKVVLWLFLLSAHKMFYDCFSCLHLHKLIYDCFSCLHTSCSVIVSLVYTQVALWLFPLSTSNKASWKHWHQPTSNWSPCCLALGFVSSHTRSRTVCLWKRCPVVLPAVCFIRVLRTQRRYYIFRCHI